MRSANKCIANRRGISLIIVVSIMMVLSIMAIVFARMMVYERISANNYCATIDARLAAFAGMDRAVVELFHHFFAGHVWGEDLTPPNAAGGTLPAINPAPESDSKWQAANRLYLLRGIVGPGRYEPDGNHYLVRIVSSAGKLNVNSHIALDNLDANVVNPGNQAISNTTLRNILYRLARASGLSHATANPMVSTIVNRPLNELKRRWRNIEEVREAIAYDPNTASAEFTRFVNNLCTDSWIDNNTWAAANPGHDYWIPPSYYREARAPVDINMASSELLRALVGGVVGQEMTVTYGSSMSDDLVFRNDPTFSETGRDTYSTETSVSNNVSWPNAVSCNDDPNNAMAAPTATVVNQIIANRPFRDHGQLHTLLGALGLADNLRDALRSNFNPNVIDTFWNPNFHTQRRVCKGDLWSGGAPSHTTEFCCYGIGGLQIEAEGWLTSADWFNQQGQRTPISYSKVEADVELGEILTHSSQTDFVTGGTFGGTTTSFPANTFAGLTPDLFGGGVEPRRRLIPGANLFYASAAPNDASNDLWPFATGSFPRRMPHSYSKLTSNQHMQIEQIVDAGNRVTDGSRVNNLAHDGIVSRRNFSSTVNGTRYFVTHCFSADAFTTSSGEIPPGGTSLVNHNTTTGTQVGNYEGTVEFWVKLERNTGSTLSPGPVFGLFSATSKDKTKNCRPNSEMLPESALYSGNQYHEGIQMYVYINSLGMLRATRLYYAFCFDSAGKYYGATFDEDRDTRRAPNGCGLRRTVRKDVEQQISWEPYTWHHVAVRWQDGGDRLQLFVDGAAGAQWDAKAGSPIGFAIANEREPRDSFFLNGFYRDERKDTDGYFRFSSMHCPGNSTIDEVISYDDNTTALSTTRYANNPSYTGLFDLDNHNCILGPIFWISYPNSPSITCSAGSYSQPNNNIATLTRNAFVIVPDVAINYTVNFNSFNSAAVSTGVRCPTLDSVALVLFHRNPKYLRIRY